VTGSSSSLSNKIPALATLIAPIVFQAIFRKRGGFIYRQIVAIILIAVSAGYGMLASLILPVFGKTHLISYSVGRVEAFLSKTFLAITATVEGQENLAKVGEPAIYVANHQTLMDISYMGCVFPKGTSIMAKRSIKYYPVLGWFSKSNSDRQQ
jgi:lysophosphatidate acyltransferase